MSNTVSISREALDEITLENQELKEQCTHLGKVLQQILSGPRSIGVIEAGPFANFYRVATNGNPTLIPIAPEDPEKLQEMLDNPFEIGATVILANNAIESLLPDELFKIEEPPVFEHISWDQIGGMTSQIEEIREAVEFPLRYPDVYKEFNQSPLKGLLLYGPPGCGKTMIAKAIASYILEKDTKIYNESFIYLKGGEMLSKYVGEAEGNIKNLFDTCRKHFDKTGQRSVVFIDEAEAIMPTRGSRVSSDVDRTIVPTFLAEMDGFNENNPFIILATNHPDQIDPAIQRPGRIDLKISVRRPDRKDAYDIFKIYLNKTKVVEDIDFLANECVKMLWERADVSTFISGAHIANVVSGGIEKAIKRRIKKTGKNGVTLEDLMETIKNHKK